MDKEVLIGNICSLCAMVTDSISSTRKKHSEILAVQSISQLFYGVGNTILKGYSSTVQNAVGILRNLAAMKNIKSKFLEWILILAGLVLGIYFNNRGLLGWLPVIANLEYSIAVFELKDSEKGLKLAFLINMIMYAIFNYVIKNYVGAVSSVITGMITLAALIRGKKTE